MRSVKLSENLKGILAKLSVRDKLLYIRVMKKIDEVANSDDHYKNLRYDMKGSKRVHVGHFVLIFSYSDDCIYFEDFDHHNYIYKS